MPAARPGRAVGPSPAWARAARTLVRIQRDRQRGAGALARATIRLLETALTADRTAVYGRRELLRLARSVARAQPAMGAFRRWSMELAARARGPRHQRTARALRRWARGERRRLAAETGRAVAIAAREFPPTERVVTISRSETVRRLLAGLSAGRRPREVRVLRSRPGGEGSLQAAALRRAGLRAHVVEDAAADGAVADADLVVIGADTVYRDRSVVHKVGTRALALAAYRRRVPVAVVAGRSKFVDAAPPRRGPVGPFDRTPARLLSVIWSGEGVVRPSERSRAWPRADRSRTFTGAARVRGPRRRA